MVKSYMRGYLVGSFISIFFGSLLLFYFIRYIRTYENHIELEVEVLEKVRAYKGGKRLKFMFENKIYSIDVRGKTFNSVEEGEVIKLYYNKDWDNFIDPNKKENSSLFGAIFFYLIGIYCFYKCIT